MIARRKDIDVESTKVGFMKVQAEITSINMKLASGKKTECIHILLFYRVGNLGNEYFEAVLSIQLAVR